MNTAYDGLLHELQKQGAYLLNKAQTEQLVNIVLQPKKGGGHEVNKKWVGKDAARHSGDHRRACAGYLPPCHLRGACRPSVRSGGADDAGAAHRALPEL